MFQYESVSPSVRTQLILYLIPDSVHWYSYVFMKINAFGLSYFEFIIGNIVTEVISENLFPILNRIIVEVILGDPDFTLNYVKTSLRSWKLQVIRLV